MWMIVELIQDHPYWVLLFTIPLILVYGRVLVRALFSPAGTRSAAAPIRRVPPRPPSSSMIKPAVPPEAGKQEVLGTSDQGAIGHQQRGSAKTVKIPVVPTKATDGSAPTDIIAPPARAATPVPPLPVKATSQDDKAIDALFGGLKAEAPAAIPEESKTSSIRRKASRMEELGFHHGIQSDAALPPVAAPSVKPMETPRSQTAELTSILERIDKFLAEDQPAKPATDKVEKPGAPAAVTAPTAVTAPAAPVVEKPAAAPQAAEKPDPNRKTQPLWARPDALDEEADRGTRKDATDKPADKQDDGGPSSQQRLF